MSSRDRGVLRKKVGVGWVEARDGAYLVLPAEISPFTVVKLSETGAFIWQCITDRTSLADVIAATAAEWETDPLEISEAVTAFIESLIRQRVLVGEDS